MTSYCGKRGLFFSILIFSILHHLIAPPLSRSDTAQMRRYPLPLGEIKYILTQWLELNGKEISDQTAIDGKVRLRFEHNGNAWGILLVPQSALATRVALLGGGGDSGSLNFEEDMWAFLNAYVGPQQEKRQTNAAGGPIPQVIQSKIGAIVCINTDANGQSSQFTGFAIDPNGTILCTAHDLMKYKTIMVTNQEGAIYQGKVVKLDATRDLALIKSRHKPGAFVSLAHGRSYLRREEKIYAIGCPMSQLGKISSGRATDQPVKAKRLHYWQVLLETSPGSSGSPVFDIKGELVGMVKGRFRGTNTIGFLIPVDRMRAFINGP